MLFIFGAILMLVVTTTAQLQIHFTSAEKTTDYQMFPTLTVPVHSVYSSRTNTIQFYHQKLQLDAIPNGKCENPSFTIAYQDNPNFRTYAAFTNEYSTLDRIIPYVLPNINDNDNILSGKSINNTIYLDVSFYPIKESIIDSTFVLQQRERCQIKMTIKTLLNQVIYRDKPIMSTFLHESNVHLQADNDLQLSIEGNQIYTTVSSQVVESKDHGLKYSEIEFQAPPTSTGKTIAIIVLCLVIPIAMFMPLYLLKVSTVRARKQSHEEEVVILDVHRSRRERVNSMSYSASTGLSAV